MKVFKFGGASVSTVERIKNVGNILKKHSGQKLLVVISAMGKTTNALEGVVTAFFNGQKEEALHLFQKIKEEHTNLSAQLNEPATRQLNDLANRRLNKLTDFFTEIEWLLHDKPVREYDYYYDQIVCVGELLATSIVSAYLNSIGVLNTWMDVRDIIRTDDNFRDARIDWQVTTEKTKQFIKPVLAVNQMVLTQGFVGATDENESTTLGREGSDYSAAIFANILNAESQTIWKDVQGVMNADPKQYSKAQWIQELNYKEVIEMAYYGAQVIHPKTIQPLQNKNIPLYVKSFIEPEAQGTIIHQKTIQNLPPIIVYKHNQVMLELSSKDFSFVGEGLTAELYTIFERIHFKPNLTQNGAISLLCVVDEHAEKVESLALEASEFFDVQVTRNLELLTIRHYHQQIINELCTDRTIILEQKTTETVQMLMQI